MEILILILAAASFLAGILAVQVFRAVRRGTSKPLDAGTVAWRACKRQQASPDGRTENLDVDDMASAAKAIFAVLADEYEDNPGGVERMLKHK